MIGALRQLFIPKPPAAVEATYIALVAAARNPFFYTELKVPDTLDGRFEMIVLHLFLLQHRILFTEGDLVPFPRPKAGVTPAASGSTNGLRTPIAHVERETFCRFLSEAFFNDMDRSIRELGVADTGVSHRIKKMGKAYHGRLQAYTSGLGDAQGLRAALARNLYGTVAHGDVTALDRLACVVEKMTELLSHTDIAIILQGQYVWPHPATL